MKTRRRAKRTDAIGQGGPLSKSAYYCFNMLFEATTKAADE